MKKGGKEDEEISICGEISSTRIQLIKLKDRDA